MLFIPPAPRTHNHSHTHHNHPCKHFDFVAISPITEQIGADLFSHFKVFQVLIPPWALRKANSTPNEVLNLDRNQPIPPHWAHGPTTGVHRSASKVADIYAVCRMSQGHSAAICKSRFASLQKLKEDLSK